VIRGDIIMNSILNLFGGFRIVIGLLILSVGIFLDFSCYGIGTCLRFILGLTGAYIMLGNTKHDVGNIIGMIWGLIGYSWAIRSGSLELLNIFHVEGFAKYGMRIACVFFFILGLKSVKEN